jgi:hypothetical protein
LGSLATSVASLEREMVSRERRRRVVVELRRARRAVGKGAPLSILTETSLEAGGEDFLPGLEALPLA